MTTCLRLRFAFPFAAHVPAAGRLAPLQSSEFTPAALLLLDSNPLTVQMIIQLTRPAYLVVDYCAAAQHTSTMAHIDSRTAPLLPPRGCADFVLVRHFVTWFHTV